MVRSIGYLAWAALGLFLAWAAFRLGLGSFDEPGPGMLSFGIGLLIAGMGLCQFAASFVRREPALTPAEVEPRAALLRTGAVVLLLAAYVVSFEPVGFILSTFVLLAVLMLFFSNLRPVYSLAMAAVLTLANYGLFKLLLGTQLPPGLLG